MTTPSHFHVSTSVEHGTCGSMVWVRIYERIESTDYERLSNTFLLDLQSLPALKAEVDRMFVKAICDNCFNSDFVEADDE